ncbi:hypothetical protein ACA910_004571 [Epithemia clementina (nom. ined.)]
MKPALCLLGLLGTGALAASDEPTQRKATSTATEDHQQNLPVTSNAKSINDDGNHGLNTADKDDAQFWDRFLNEFDMDKFVTNPWYIKPHKLSFSEEPTMPPTERPNRSPSPPPTIPPSPPPSSPPSNLPCNVSVTSTCEDQDEVPCDEIPPPEAMCFSTGNNVIEVLSFTYLPGNTCAMSRNQQYNTSTCQDLGPLDDVPVTLACVDNNGNAMVVNEQNITVDGKILFTVLPPGGSGSFPPSITCTIRNANTGQALQRNTIDTSGDSELGLKEAYGAMQLESCDDQVCIQEVFFRNVIENLGGDFMEVNLVNITIVGREPQDLTYLVSPNPLPPGDRFTLVDVVYLDYCETGNISYFVEVDANPPFGEQCDDEDKVIFPIEPECEVMLNLTCVEIDTGIPCDEVPPIENPQCVCPECSDMLMFRYTGESCGNNGDGVTCVQTGSMSPLGGTLQVATDASFSDTIFSQTVTPGVDIRILDDSQCIPDTLYIRLIAEGTQTITLDTACTTGNGLDLGKAVGALDFVGFSCADGSSKDCFSDVLLTTCPINQGTIPLFLTNFSVGIVGQEMTDLLGDQDIVLLPGEAYCGEGTAEIYKCNDTMYTVVSNVEANDTSAKGCQQTNQTQFEITTDTAPPSASPSKEPSAPPTIPESSTPSAAPSRPPTSPPTPPPSKEPSAPPTIPESSAPSAAPSRPPTSPPTPPPSNEPSAPPTIPESSAPSAAPSSPPTNQPCNVTVTTVCEDQNEVPCDEIPPPEGQCFSTGNNAIEVLSFSYLPGNTCSMSRNQQYNTSTCVDLGPLEDVPVTLACVDNNGNAMVVNEQNITVDGDILYTVLPPGSSGTFPPSITCTIRNANTGQELQRNTIDTSGNSELGLKEAFGAMQLESCDDQVCIPELFFSNVIENLGGDFMEVTLVNITIAGRDPQDLTYLVSPNPLPPGDRYTLIDVVYIDYCETGSISYSVDIQANPLDGTPCEAEDKVIFPITPNCSIALNLTCTEIGTGIDCSSLQPLEDLKCECTENMDDCPTSMVFRYSGNNCQENAEGIICQQQPDTTMSPSGGTLRLFSDQSGTTILFQSQIEPFTSVSVQTEGCLPDVMYIQVETETGTQDIQLTHGCSSGQGIDLASAVGALDFVGLECQDGEQLNCFSDVDLDTCTINQGTIDLTLTSFDVSLEGVTLGDSYVTEFDLLEGNIFLEPGQAYCGEGIAEIYKCAETAYTVTSAVTANDTSGIGCNEEVAVNFNIGPPGTPPPSSSPSAPPSAPPTIGSSAPPSAPPSIGSSAPPSAPPSIGSSAPPSALPSIGSSAPPSAPPSIGSSAPPSAPPIIGSSAPPSTPPSIGSSASPSAPPSIGSSAPPSAPPSIGSSAPPSTAPSKPPTMEPSSPPSAPPTSKESLAPTVPPSQPPSDIPSEQPTGYCTVNVEVVCEVVGNEGLNCNDLQPPPSSRCASGERLDSITLSYIGPNNANCEDSRNQQGEEARCVDVNQFVNGPVDIECFDLIMTPLIVEPTNVQPGGIFSVTSDVPGTPLVQKINCTISQVGFIRQWDVIDVSGNVELDLQEQYGALVLESCDGLNCVEFLNIRTFIQNIGLAPMNVSLADETFEGVTSSVLADLLPLSDGALVPPYSLDIAQSAFYERTGIRVDLCDTGTFTYDINVEATPPNGLICNDTETLVINIAPECNVTTTFECTYLETGQDCSEIPKIESPDCDCGETCPTEMLFRYSPTTCDESPPDSSFAVVNCEQLLDMPANPTITVQSDGTQYFNGEVSPDQNIVLSAGGACLSETFSVLVQDSTGEAVQRFTLEPGCTNGNSRSIGLADSYVSFDFFGFTCQESLPVNCYSDVEIEQCAINDGVVDLTITTLDQTFDDTTVSVLNDPSVVPVLEPGMETCATPRQYEIYLCDTTTTTYTFSGLVEADDTSATNCFDNAELSFSVLPPETFPPTFFPTEFPSPVPSQPPSVVPSIAPTENCALEVNLSCVGCTVNNSDLPLCEERPTLIGMLFRGGNCSQNNFSQPLTKVTCVDFNQQAPPLGSNATVFIRANADPKDGLPGGTGGDSETLLFEGLVTEGSVFYMYDGGNRLPADTQIRMWPATGPRDSSTILQDVRFHASCSQPFLLNNVFGSYQFVMFQNELQGNVTLFLSQTSDFDISIPINGLPTGDTILTIFNATIRTNYTDPPVSILTPLIGQKLCSPEVAADPTNDCNTSTVEVEFDTTLNLAQPQGYLQEITILAIGDETGQRCIGRGVLEFFAPLSSDFGEVVDD